jgi:hypothetical protein
MAQEGDKEMEIDDTIEDDMENNEEVPVETDLEEGSEKGPRTCSMEKEERRRDTNGAYWITSEKSKCFDTVHSIFVVELPIKHHKLLAVVEAKEVEVNNLKLFNTYEEVDDVGQPTVGSHWVITKKEKHDGQKTDYKGRIVAKGFQETEKPQSDSPTVMRESVKIFLSVAANKDYELVSVDIKAAFLQSRDLDRDVFVEPPGDLKTDGKIW